MSKNSSPLEHDEQVAVVEWIETQNQLASLFKARQLDPILYSAIANGHWQQSRSQQNKLKAEGMQSGVPDLVLVVPSNRSKSKKPVLVWIEMKRRVGGVVSASQQQWIDAINEVSGERGDVGAFVCYGSDDAIALLQDIIEML